MQEQQCQEAVDALMGAQDDDGYLRGKQEDEQHQDTAEDPGSEIHLSRGSDRSCNANDQATVDEDGDEELRPTKRRKRDLVHPTLASLEASSTT